MPKNLSVYEFIDYKGFLKAYFKDRQSKRKGFSLRLWTIRLNLASPSSLSMVLNNVREAGADLTDKLIGYFGFSEQESKYFRRLIKLSKAKKRGDETTTLIKEIESMQPKSKFKVIDDVVMEAISDWYYFAIRELVNTRNFREDYDWIAKRLNRKISPIKAKNAVKKMISLGLLKRSQHDNKLYQTDGNLMAKSEVSTPALKEFHHQMLNIAQESVRSVAVEMREITGFTLNITLSRLESIKKIIREFRISFCDLNQGKEGDETYQLSVLFFPLTNIEMKKA